MRYWIGLGSNLGDRLGHLRQATELIGAVGTIVKKSRVFAASPVGGPPQPPFLNAALILDSDLEPPMLLAELQRIEAECGRTRTEETVRWGPRTLDLDILLAGVRGETVLTSPGLEIPHPRLASRAFALGPMVDLNPDLLHPVAARTLAALYQSLHGTSDVTVPMGDAL